MKRVLLHGICLQALLALAVSAQPVRVYSEFAVINDKGEATAPEFPREILSPAVARNAFASFQVVIDVPQGTPFQLYIGQNPENAVEVTLYKRVGKTLQPVSLPYESSSTEVLWLDIWVEKDAPVRRIKVEPQVKINGDWIIYPMEVRVREPQVPEAVALSEHEGDPAAVLRADLCGVKLAPRIETKLTMGRVQFRNAQQDASLMAQGSKDDGEELRKRLGGCNAKPSTDPEMYLRARDYLFARPWEKIK